MMQSEFSACKAAERDRRCGGIAEWGQHGRCKFRQIIWQNV